MSDDQPAEEFRRVTAAAMRAIAEREDVTLVYGSEARLVDNQARLPIPSRDFTEKEIAALRGEADAMALRLRFHDEGLHATRAPQGETRVQYSISRTGSLRSARQPYDGGGCQQPSRIAGRKM